MTVTDWRKTPINIGDIVVYGSGVGQSIQLNEGEIVAVADPKPADRYGRVTPAKVRVRIIRRSYMSGSQAVVTVGSDRVTVVTELPPCDLPTQEAINEPKIALAAQQEENRKSHTMPPKPKDKRPKWETFHPEWNYHDRNRAFKTAQSEWEKVDYEHSYGKCLVCGVEGWYLSKNACGKVDDVSDDAQ